MLARWAAYVRGIARRRRTGDEVEDELRFHVEHEIEAHVVRGVPAAEARRMALRDLGGLTQTREAVRDVRTIWLDSFLRDIRHALRSLRATPAFTAVALTVLTLSIGASTAIFSVVDAVILRGLPFDESDRLVAVGESSKDSPFDSMKAAPQNFLDWRTQQDVFSGLAAVADSEISLRRTGDAMPENLRAQHVTADFFTVLRTPPVIGRPLTIDDEDEGRTPVAVISYALWQRGLGGRPDVIGAHLPGQRASFEIVGVMPPSFSYPAGAAEPTDVWIPYVPRSDERVRGNSFGYYLQVIVDGLSANDDAAGLSGITYGVDAVEQFQVVTSGAQAELGRALGGYVNVVTKSGTSILHGTVYDYVRDDLFNANNPLSRGKLAMSQSQYGGSLGGPLVSNRVFYFTNLEQRRLDQTGLATISAANVNAVNARLAAVGYQGPLVATGVYPNPVDSTNLLVRMDHQLHGRDQLSVRYSLYEVSAENSRGAGGLNAPSASSGLDNMDQTIALSNTLTLSSRTVLETRAQLAHGDLAARPADPIGPAVSIAGVASFGTSSGSPTRRVNTFYQVVNNLSHQAGAHALKFGADYLHNDVQITYPRAIRGSYTFSSLGNFLAGVYNNAGFTQTFGASEVSQTNPNVGMYMQDEWKMNPRVTVNLGVRYDLQFLETINTDSGNISPRFGVAWSPLDGRRTIVRGSVGLFYDRVPLRALANAMLSAGNTTDLNNLRQIGVSLSPGQTGAPTFPNILSEVVPSVTLVNLTTMDRDLQNAYSRQASVEVERQLGDQSTASIGYQYLRGRDLLMSVNQNVPTCVASGTNNGCRANPNFANNSQYSSVGESSYHGLHISFTQRSERWGHYRVSYTLSKSMNNLGEFFFSSPIDPFDLSKDWGRSDDDQRHRLVVNAAVRTSMEPARTAWQHMTSGFQLSGMLQAYSTLPFNITSGVNTVQGTTGRPIVAGSFIPRNAGIGSDFVSLNLRVSRAFPLIRRVQLEALAEAFNLTNHRNVLARNTNFGAGAYPMNPLPTFGQITAVGEPRSFQFGARLRF